MLGRSKDIGDDYLFFIGPDNGSCERGGSLRSGGGRNQLEKKIMG